MFDCETFLPEVSSHLVSVLPDVIAIIGQRLRKLRPLPTDFTHAVTSFLVRSFRAFEAMREQEIRDMQRVLRIRECRVYFQL